MAWAVGILATYAVLHSMQPQHACYCKSCRALSIATTCLVQDFLSSCRPPRINDVSNGMQMLQSTFNEYSEQLTQGILW